MEQIAIAVAIYKKDSDRNQPQNIVGLKIFPLNTSTGRPDYTQPAMIIWKDRVNALVLAGLEAPVYESQPLKPEQKQ